MAEQTRPRYRQAKETYTWFMRQATVTAKGALNVPVEICRFALDTSLQVVEAARTAGVPLPDTRVERLKKQVAEHERQYHERTVHFLGSLYLKATLERSRDRPYAVQPEAVLEVLGSFCQETGVDVREVMDPHASLVIETSLDNHLPD